MYADNASYENTEGEGIPSRTPWPNPEVNLSAASLEGIHTSQQRQLISRQESEDKEDGSKRLTCCQIFVLISSVILILFSVAMLSGGFDLMFDSILKSQMAIQEGSLLYDVFVKMPVPMLLKLYVFNITNPEGVLKGDKPILQECGPYVWREYHEKKMMEFHSNKTVTYLQQRWWIFDEELTGNNSIDDMVYSVNPIPVGTGYWMKKFPAWLATMAIEVINKMFKEVGEQAIMKVTVNDLLFDGFEEPVLKWVRDNVVAENGTYHPFLPLLNIPPGLLDFDRFGWFYGRNMSLYFDGVFSIFTGVDDLANLGKIDMWNYTRETKFFDSPCNKVVGSGGEFFPPGMKRDKIQFYNSDMCMSVTMPYKEDVVVGGVNGYRYWASNTTFANGSTVPGNECYCVKGTCAPYGMLNSESCRMGTPAYVSFPHFFNADPFLLDQVDGLSPDEEKHSFYMDFMPEIAAGLTIRVRIQINMKIVPYPGKFGLERIDILANLPDVYLPMIWFEAVVDMPEEVTSPLQALQYFMNSPWIMIVVFSVMLAIGLIMMVSLIVVRLRK